MKKTAIISFFTALVAPIVAWAQDTSYIDNWIVKLTQWLSTAISIIMILMTLWFLWGVFKYIAEKDAGKLPERRKMMLNGLIGLFVAVSVWGIIGIAQNVFGTKYNNTPDIVCPPGMVIRANKCSSY